MVPPSETDWLDIIRSAPANKAPGPSGISYDIIKRLGIIAHNVLYQLTCACFTLRSIPDGWKRATVYPIPKPKPWQYNLTNTRPITLLESARKIMVKIMHQRLATS